MSAFALDEGVIYHTYSTYERGVDALWACTNGLTAQHSVATRPACGGAATMNTTLNESAPSTRGRNRRRYRPLPSRPPGCA
jgi:hypothetical protein